MWFLAAKKTQFLICIKRCGFPSWSSSGQIPSCKYLKDHAITVWNFSMVLGPCNVSQTMPMRNRLSLVAASDSKLHQEYTHVVFDQILPNPVIGTQASLFRGRATNFFCISPGSWVEYRTLFCNMSAFLLFWWYVNTAFAIWSFECI